MYEDAVLRHPRIRFCDIPGYLGDYTPGRIRINYYPSTDLLGFSPTPEAFVFHYTLTLLHELTHWAGHNHHNLKRSGKWDMAISRIIRATR